MDDRGAGQPAGFRNMEPRTREERIAGTSKELLEKSRIQARYAGGHKPAPPPVNPLLPVKNSPMYIDEYDRFNRDAARQEQQRKQDELNKKEALYQRRKEEGYWRENQKWQKEEHVYSKVETKYEQLRSSGQGGAKRGQSSEQYNIITLDYANTPGGQALKAKDESVRYKAQLRAVNLYTKNNSVTHNIITGEPARMPVAPVAPWDK